MAAFAQVQTFSTVEASLSHLQKQQQWIPNNACCSIAGTSRSIMLFVIVEFSMEA
jgi:hypothetical protein